MSDNFNQEQINALQKQTAAHEVLIDKISGRVSENGAATRAVHARLDEMQITHHDLKTAIDAAPTKDDIREIIETSFNSQVVGSLKKIGWAFLIGVVGVVTAGFAKFWDAGS